MTEFGTLNLEEVAGEDARLSKEGTANFLEQFVPMPDVKPGQTGLVTIRILPPIKGGKLFQYNRTHKINERSVHCPRPLVNGKWDKSVPCAICNYYSQLWKDIDALTKEGRIDECNLLKKEAREIKPTERYYYNAIVRSMMVDGKELKNQGPKILSVGVILHKMIIRAIVGEEGDPDSKLGNVTDLKNGWDFVIRKEVTVGEGFPKYDGSKFARNQSPAGTPEEIKKWQESLHDLTKLRNPKNVEYIEKELAIHRGMIPDDTQAFDITGFDAKWRKSDEELVTESTSTSVVVNDSATQEPAAAKAAKAKKKKPEETATIEDEEFLRQIQEMEM